MSEAGSVTADELVRALKGQQATLPAEIASFIALEACESMLRSGPRELVGLSHLRLSESGGVALSGAACDEARGARTLVRVYASLLAASGSGVSPAFSAAAEDVLSLSALRDVFEAALVPLNRHASARVLARYVREAALAPLAREDVDAALNSLLGVGEEPANDVEQRSPGFRSVGPADAGHLQVNLLDGLELEDEAPRIGEPIRHNSRHDSGLPLRERPIEPSRPPSLRSSYAPREAAEHAQASSLRARADELVEIEPGASSPHKVLIGFTLAGLAVAIVAFALSVRSARETEPPPMVEERSSSASSSAPSAAHGDLIVDVSEPNAQVLRLVGRAPVEIPGLPIGVAHEFAAVAPGHRPARVLIPANAEWDSVADGGARYEVALQLAEQAANPDGERELGPSRLIAPSGGEVKQRGTVRVVTTPRGASVYQLIGFSPNVRVEGLSLTEPQELLVYREGFRPVVRAVISEEFAEKAGRKVAEVKIDLSKR